MNFNNPYSKLKFTNSYNIKHSIDDKRNIQLLGTDLRNPIDKKLINDQISKNTSSYSMWGVSWITNYIYKTERINGLGTTAPVPSLYKRPTLFSLFKLY